MSRPLPCESIQGSGSKFGESAQFPSGRMAPPSPPTAASTAAAILGGSHPRAASGGSSVGQSSQGAHSTSGSSHTHPNVDSSSQPNGTGDGSTDAQHRAGTPSSFTDGGRSRSSSFGSTHAAGALHSLSNAHQVHHHGQPHQHHPSHLHTSAVDEEDSDSEPSSSKVGAERLVTKGKGKGNASEEPKQANANEQKSGNMASGSLRSQGKQKAVLEEGSARATPATQTPAKRSPGAGSNAVRATPSVGDDSMASTVDTATGKKQRKKKTNRACHHCQKAHLTCDECKFFLGPLVYMRLQLV